MANSSSRNKYSVPLAIIGAVSLGYWSSQFFSSAKKKENKDETKIEERDTTIVVETDHAPIVSPFIPQNIQFAGQTIPLDKLGVREKLDRELVINCYWHSNTIFYMKRAGRWFPMIEKILKEHDLPNDFKYLAVIESGLDNVVSPSGAAGFWQFMKSTAKEYGLEVNRKVDERYHPEKATHAACKFLKEMYRHYDDWMLAAASFNMGRGALDNRLEEQKVDNYFDLLLNAETARYMYRIIAVKLIFENPAKYGFQLQNNDLYQPYATRVVNVEEDVENWVDFALEQESNYRNLKIMNPWLRSTSLHVNKGKTYDILLPEN